MALDTHTKRLLWSGLRAGASASAATVAATFGSARFLMAVLDRLPSPSMDLAGGILAIVTFLFSGPVVAWGIIRFQKSAWPLAVRYPENAVGGALWGAWGGLILWWGHPLQSITAGTALGCVLGAVAALVPYRIVWFTLIFSPLPALLLHLLMSP
ncbi:MAG: hypothetical protein FD126_514 [Elusimicrobia bacterium]|nr:MAG: hypothetical protein FD126_514 [Elusimicrobiota bacterium]